MRYFALASDYDGTLANEAGRVDPSTYDSLRRLRESGRMLILVTGRELENLLDVFPGLRIFDRVVAENGGLLFNPASNEQRVLAEPPSARFIDELRVRGVSPLSIGQAIVSTRVPHDGAVLDAIRDLGLELQVTFNKGAVMVLPPGIHKGTGLAAALDELGLSAHNVVAVGDAENDHAFLSSCECGVAVANALPTLRERADMVTRGSFGAGVKELAERLLEDDLKGLNSALTRHSLIIGLDSGGHEVRLPALDGSVIIAGPSGSGKTSATSSLLERMAEQHYQFCLVDPEGDYEALPAAAQLGTAEQPPTLEELKPLLQTPRTNVVVNLLAVSLEERPRFFTTLLSQLQQLRGLTGRPHWIVLDEAHHVLPSAWEPATATVSQEASQLLLITLDVRGLARAVVGPRTSLIALGAGMRQTVRSFAELTGRTGPQTTPNGLEAGEALVWLHDQAEPTPVRLLPASTERRRHRRKYADGALSTEESFYFRGPQGKLNLRAQNLSLFSQLAEGVDDETWEFHLRRGDYSRWFEAAIKDEDLAGEAAEVERDTAAGPRQTKERVLAAINTRYMVSPRPPDPA